MPAGRPSTCTPQVVKKAREYLANYETIGDAIPSIAGLAVYLKKGRKTLYDWSSHEENREFSHILEEILATQENVLMSKGLRGDFNAQIVKLALGKHGYSDRQETELSGKGGGPIETVTKIELISLDDDSEG